MTITRTDGIQWRTLVRPSLLATTLAFAPACSRAPEAHAPARLAAAALADPTFTRIRRSPGFRVYFIAES
ncbi:MAG TPA: hypothetical protein VFD73_00300 [Gemmatimonadales bacterium]|nr:hypothetical protein [Gemmatimonadales bacterium]